MNHRYSQSAWSLCKGLEVAVVYLFLMNYNSIQHEDFAVNVHLKCIWDSSRCACGPRIANEAILSSLAGAKMAEHTAGRTFHPALCEAILTCPEFQEVHGANAKLNYWYDLCFFSILKRIEHLGREVSHCGVIFFSIGETVSMTQSLNILPNR